MTCDTNAPDADAGGGEGVGGGGALAKEIEGAKEHDCVVVIGQQLVERVHRGRACTCCHCLQQLREQRVDSQV